MDYIGEFEQIILFALLHIGEEAYGVTIREAIEARTGRTVSSGAIYTALSRMESRGLVRSRVAGTPGRGRPRRYYAVEAAGARALRSAYETTRAMSEGLLPRLTELAEES